MFAGANNKGFTKVRVRLVINDRVQTIECIRPEQPHHYEAVIYVDITTATMQVDIRTLTPTYVHIVAT